MLLMRRNLLTASLGALSLCAVLLVDLGLVHGRRCVMTALFIRPWTRSSRAWMPVWGRTRLSIGSAALTSSWREPGDGFGLSDGRRLHCSFPESILRVHDAYSENRLPKGWVNLFYGTARNAVLMDLLTSSTRLHTRPTAMPCANLFSEGLHVTNYQILERKEISSS